MELRTNLGPISRTTHEAQRRLADGVKSRHAKDADVPSKRDATVDARIGSLRILAQSLMRQIEILEEEAHSDSSYSFDAQTEVRRFEAELIRSALIKTGGRQRRAARLLGMKVTTLNTKIKRYGINLEPGSLSSNSQISDEAN
jgi:DNA-binding NtrC family response regulator